MQSAAIITRSLTKSYGNLTALDSFDLEVEQGSIFGLLGPNGAGKTTLIRILTTLMRQSGGDASIEGLDILRSGRQIRSMIGVVSQENSLDRYLTARENLELHARLHGMEKRLYKIRIDELLELMGLAGRQKDFPDTFSGGMQRRLVIARALVHQPKVLFLDEPTTGVDAVSRLEFWEMLKRLKEAGITILVSTPYMDEASLCDRVALMQNGHIMTISTPREVIRNYPLSLLSVKAGDIYNLLGELRKYPGVHSVYAFGQTAHVSFRNREVEKDILSGFLKKNKHESVEIMPIEATIEDCFMELMNNNH